MSNLTAPSLAAAETFLDSPEYKKRLTYWAPGYEKQMRDTVADGIASGKSPTTIARQIRQYATNMPPYAAENFTRTLQMQAYHRSELDLESVNGRFIEYKLRIATLGPTCCLACVALHGTRLEKGEELQDHYSGRCSVFYVVPGGPRTPDSMQADSTPGHRNFVPWKNGEDWFASLSPARQAQQSSFLGSPGKLKLYQSGKAKLADFVGDHTDDVFGGMKIEKSLKDVVKSLPTIDPADDVAFFGGDIDQRNAELNRRLDIFLEKTKWDPDLAGWKEYIGYGYKDMNSALRGGLAGASSRTKQYIAEMLRLFDTYQFSIAPGTTVYRGIRISKSSELYRQLMSIGTIFTDHGFISTTVESGVASQFLDQPGRERGKLLLQILCPQGGKVLPGLSRESELIFPPGTRFRVTGANPQSGVITLEVLS